ncbi:MAG: ATP-dependent helicase [Candidatus Taylorbacteria bacterium]|nr:ATP-dependent helicase [Candidatus Taylorbacteria bacterium]
MRDSKFLSLYRRLSRSQKEAVDATQGPVMVVAGPGTGKTTVLTLRIANILRKTDTPPGAILAITFTEAGVWAMRSKLEEVIGRRAEEVRIQTFHSLAASLIAEFDDHFIHLRGAERITEIEAGEMIRKILPEKKFSKLRPLGDRDFYVGKILSAISEAKKDALSPAVLRRYAEEEIERPAGAKGRAEREKQVEKCRRTLALAELYRKYEEHKRREKKIDYDDLIIEAVNALKSDKLLRALVQEKFLYVLLDEHQDTNDSQNSLVSLISGFDDQPNLFVVGDDKQAIYRFQGASVANFLSFKKQWRGVKTIALKESFRSQQTILDAGHRLVRGYGGQAVVKPVKLRSLASCRPRQIEVVRAGNTAAGEACLVESIRRLSLAPERKKAAVIVRTNREVERVVNLLKRSGLEASAERGVDIFAHPLGAVFFELLEFIADPARVDSLAKTISSGLWLLSFSEAVEGLLAARRGQWQKLESLIPGLEELRERLNEDGAMEYLSRAGAVSGLMRLTAREPSAAEVWRGIMRLAEELVERGNLSRPLSLIESLLAYRRSAERRSVKLASGPVDSPISVLTAHGAKGLEFDVVFLPYATEESWLPRERHSYFVLPAGREEGEELRDARRLFYVALTRAKEHMVIISPAEDASRSYRELRFIHELGRANVEFKKLPKAEANWIPLEKEGARSREMVELGKRIMTEEGLSVTALNHFLNCPKKFLYKSIMRLPEAPAPLAEKGAACHAALSRLWKLRGRNRQHRERGMKKAVGDYLKNSLLPPAEKERVRRELFADIPKVLSSLKEHFAEKGQVFTEKRLETAFTHYLKGQPVRVRLHGRLDAVIVRGEEALVFDYKTRSRMSLRQIKGETRNSDGSYFRQLVFYKILLSDSPRYLRFRISPALVFVKPDRSGLAAVVPAGVSEEDLARVKNEINSLIESVWSGAFLADSCGRRDCQWCRLYEVSILSSKPYRFVASCEYPIKRIS